MRYSAASVLYDYQIFASQLRGGVSKYFVALAEEICDSSMNVTILSPVYVNLHLRESARARRTGYFIPAVRGTGRLRMSICRQLTDMALRASSARLIHQTYFDPGYRVPSRMAVVTTLYDMIPERLYGSNPYWKAVISMKRDAVKKADRVLCISESTKRDAMEFIGGPEERYVVTHLGCAVDHSATNLPYRLTRPYLLYVGSRSWYKNFGRLLQAYAASNDVAADVDLLCAGGGPFTSGEMAEIRRLNLVGRVSQLDVRDQDLVGLYRQAIALVYPSEYEGFGLPPLEAMSVGCPVICSNVSSMPEIVGECGEYFDPLRVESIRTALVRVVFDSSLRATLAQKGPNRASRFTWRKCAEVTEEVYKSCL